MGEITHDHLNAVADRLEASVDRLEASYRRECDQMRAEIKDDLKSVHARIGDVNDSVKTQNGRLSKSEQAIGVLRQDARVLLHDFRNHLQGHGPASAVVPAAHTKGFTAGVTATLLVLAGIGHSVWDWAVTYLPGLIKAWRQP